MIHKATIVTRVVPGVDEVLQARLVAGLNQNLASLTDLAVPTSRPTGTWSASSSQLHELFDQFAEQAREYMDLIAERAVTIGGVARGTIHAAVEGSTLPAFPIEERDEVRLLEELVGRIDTLTADLRQAMDESADEAATQDVYTEVVRGIEKQRWMLQAHLAGP